MIITVVVLEHYQNSINVLESVNMGANMWFTWMGLCLFVGGIYGDCFKDDQENKLMVCHRAPPSKVFEPTEVFDDIDRLEGSRWLGAQGKVRISESMFPNLKFIQLIDTPLHCSDISYPSYSRIRVNDHECIKKKTETSSMSSSRPEGTTLSSYFQKTETSTMRSSRPEGTTRASDDTKSTTQSARSTDAEITTEASSDTKSTTESITARKQGLETPTRSSYNTKSESTTARKQGLETPTRSSYNTKSESTTARKQGLETPTRSSYNTKSTTESTTTGSQGLTNDDDTFGMHDITLKWVIPLVVILVVAFIIMTYVCYRRKMCLKKRQIETPFRAVYHSPLPEMVDMVENRQAEDIVEFEWETSSTRNVRRRTPPPAFTSIKTD